MTDEQLAAAYPIGIGVKLDNGQLGRVERVDNGRLYIRIENTGVLLVVSPGCVREVF